MCKIMKLVGMSVKLWSIVGQGEKVLAWKL